MIIIHLLLIEVFGGLGLGAKVALGVTDVRKAVVWTEGVGAFEVKTEGVVFGNELDVGKALDWVDDGIKVILGAFEVQIGGVVFGNELDVRGWRLEVGPSVVLGGFAVVVLIRGVKEVEEKNHGGKV